MNDELEPDTERDEFELTPVEAVCSVCRLVGNKYLAECGNCFGPSIHDREESC